METQTARTRAVEKLEVLLAAAGITTMKINRRSLFTSLFTRVLLVLVLIAGCCAIVWMGAHRPERLIVGKWRISAAHTIEFESAGYYTETRKQEGTQILTGRFYFPSKSRLHLQIYNFEVDGEDVVLGGSAGLTPVEMGIHISGDNANVDASGSSATYGQVWRRIK